MPSRSTYLILAVLAWWAAAEGPGPVLAGGGIAAPQQTSPSPQSRQNSTETYIVSFGLFGGESVFESEARGAARILREWLRARPSPLVSFNSKWGGAATARTLAAALRTAGAAMDPDNGTLVVVLTSHGTPEGLAIVAGTTSDTLTPPDLRRMLDASGAKYRIVIISACYSGVFVPALADPRTLVITAAAADRPSFGCQDGARWTYFGDAFFNRSLRRAPDLETAFEGARRLVTARERRDGFEPSRPQLAGGSEVLALLARHNRPARSGFVR
ncbi:Peptidase C13, legumain asparaginyl peptidase (plasmid) [Methylobacterium nodulans ORS 2060]|uniref:Peptidase C13, legumain asparaginyl peptidase n=2 Tax=Methylobacterium nodulans TaxID=114616 RepID=B8IXM1_METNO|nr:Peptidase C13, legumain asparaginyl peptidase [Methylobacterium nodulans ORS 2060]